jgi:hypothetical protein
MKEVQLRDVVIGYDIAPDANFTSAINILVAAPQVSDNLVAVSAQLQNPSATGARFGIAMSGLIVGPPHDARVRYVGPPRPPPVPPPPVVVEMPPVSFMRLDGLWQMNDWQWEGNIDVEMTWSISLVPGPHVSGAFQVKLPNR